MFPGDTLHPIRWTQMDLSLGVKWPGQEAAHSPPCKCQGSGCADLYFHSLTCLQSVVLQTFRLTLQRSLNIPLNVSRLPTAPELRYAYHHYDERLSVSVHGLLHT